VQPAHLHVLVGNADVGGGLHLLVGGGVGLLAALLNDDFEHHLSAHIPADNAKRNFGLAVELGGGFDHVVLLVGVYPCNPAVILNAEQQRAARGVGKGGQRAGYLLRVGNRILKVEMQPFSFSNSI